MEKKFLITQFNAYGPEPVIRWSDTLEAAKEEAESMVSTNGDKPVYISKVIGCYSIKFDEFNH